MLKPFAKGQDFLSMVGYITKDQGMSHYQLRSHQITQREIDEGRREHAAMASNYDENKKVISFRSLFSDSWKFNQRSFEPAVVPIDACLAYMIQSGSYSLSPEFVMSSYKKLDFAMAQTYWRMMHEPKSTTMDEVRNLMFDSRTFHKGLRKRYFESPLYEVRQEGSSSPTIIAGSADSIPTVTPQKHQSLVSKLVDQCREGVNTMQTPERLPIYPDEDEDLVTFTEERSPARVIEILNQEGRMIGSSSALDHIDDDDFECPPTLTEMMNVTAKLRERRLKQLGHKRLRSSAEATPTASHDSSSMLTPPSRPRDDPMGFPRPAVFDNSDEDDQRRLRHSANKKKGYKVFCLDSDCDD